MDDVNLIFGIKGQRRKELRKDFLYANNKRKSFAKGDYFKIVKKWIQQNNKKLYNYLWKNDISSYIFQKNLKNYKIRREKL
ncbi:hypothetical protein [Clostridium botulinum]|uniref:hypothetical protein n=1 Tax=Clostridium botulinum TaxID=1491 RepID=UPI0004D5D3F5|nr:hypothetical protein [Clostridium botulinum]KEI07350.1 hypothetical protein Z952_09010 [Clostridium botulinum C/D str. BKT75002]KEI11433.1 hypothetical protein Z954_07710 [Clostridium botulinum C/D str. BKT2873]QPW61954.1 hypothetical protein IG390_02620 [Clostridium botulinum]